MVISIEVPCSKGVPYHALINRLEWNINQPLCKFIKNVQWLLRFDHGINPRIITTKVIPNSQITVF